MKDYLKQSSKAENFKNQGNAAKIARRNCRDRDRNFLRTT